jgi:hypothetical protein
MDLPYRFPTRSWELGIDFGSTFSAVAFCLTSDSIEFGCQAGEVCSITAYPRRQGDKSLNFVRSEVPTKLRYEQGGQYKRWGWDVVYHEDNGLYRTIPGHLLELFKCGLDDHESSLDARDRLGESLSQLPFQKSVDEVVLDYLTKLLMHAKTRLEAIGYHEGDKVHFTFTVPAMWSIRARRRTIIAAENAKKQAGFSLGKSVSLCSEPEAATAYVFHKFENIKLRVGVSYIARLTEISLTLMKEGDTFIVCDAGGVTVVRRYILQPIEQCY